MKNKMDIKLRKRAEEHSTQELIKEIKVCMHILLFAIMSIGLSLSYLIYKFHNIKGWF